MDEAVPSGPLVKVWASPKAQVLRALDESNPINHGGRGVAHGASAMWDAEQTTSLVVPYRFNPHLGRPSELPDSHRGD